MRAYRTVFCTEFLRMFPPPPPCIIPDVVCVDLLDCAYIGLLRVGFMHPYEIDCWLEYVGPIEL
jgi:hypothetical protein